MRAQRALPAVLALAACGHPAPAPVVATPPPALVPGDASVATAPVDAPPPSQDELLAAIQKAMTDLDGAARQCWAAVAVERFDIEGNLEARITVDTGHATIELVTDTTRSPKLAACMTSVLAAYPWAPPLRGQTIQLPFKFRAPDGQSVVDRALVPFHGQGKIAVAVLLDENNTGNAAASMFEVALEANATTGMRSTTRPELWFPISGAGTWRSPGGQGDLPAYVPAIGAREIVAGPTGLHALVVVTPGGAEGAARAGALPTPELVAGGKFARPLTLHGATWCPGQPTVSTCDGVPCCGGAPPSVPPGYPSEIIYAEPAVVHAAAVSATAVRLAAGGQLAAHRHAKETELLAFREGGGTLTIDGNAFPVTATSVAQIPPGMTHSFVAAKATTVLQFFTPAGPEQAYHTTPPGRLRGGAP